MGNQTAKQVEDSFVAEMARSSQENSASNTGGATETQPKDATVPVSPTYEFNGRQLTAEQLYEETRNLQKDYTQKTQKLSELETKVSQIESTPQTQLAPQKGDTGVSLSEVDQRMQQELDRLGYVRVEKLDETIQKRTPDLIKEASTYTQRSLDTKSQFDALESEWNGEGEKPKIERADVVKWVNERGLQNLSPKEAVNLMYHDQFVKYEARALAGEVSKPNLPDTERNGANQVDPPKPPQYSFKDGSAERAAREIMQTR